MVEYTEEQIKQLRERWKGHEDELEALICVIRDDRKESRTWHLSKEYLALKETVGLTGDKTDLRGIRLCSQHLCGANLERVDLSGADLRDAKLHGANLENAVLKNAELPGAKLTNANLFGADLCDADIQGADLRRANLSYTAYWVDVKWTAKDRIWPKIKHFVLRGKKPKLSERQTLFDRNNIRNANWTGAALLKRYVEDENFLAEYIESVQPALKVLSWQSWRSSFPRLPRKIWLCLWELTCNYGRSFWRWAVFSAIIAGVFAVIYWRVFGCDSIAFDVDRLNGVQPDFLGYLYYSVVTFTTLGFGDIVPLTNWARLAVGAEVILGYIMLGGLISIFANKLARRS